MLAPQISKRSKFPSVSLCNDNAILIASWPPVVENGSDSGVVDRAALMSSQSFFYSLLLTFISYLPFLCLFHILYFTQCFSLLFDLDKNLNLIENLMRQNSLSS